MYRNAILMNRCAHTRKNTAKDKKLCIHLMYSPMTSYIFDTCAILNVSSGQVRFSLGRVQGRRVKKETSTELVLLTKKITGVRFNIIVKVT